MPGKHRRAPRPQRTTETSDYVAMMTRIIFGYGQRIGDDPAALVHLREIETALRDSVNHGMFLANRGQNNYSQNEQARILGVSRQAVSKRIKLGEQRHVQLELIRTHGSGALVRIADIRAERAAGLAAAEVEDKTGSERERAALKATGTDNVRPIAFGG